MGDERALLERAREYDPAALGEIYDRYSVKIYNYIYRRLGDAHLAEDLTADVFVKMLEAIRASVPWRISFSGWLYRIAHNAVIDYLRRHCEERELHLNERLIAAGDSPTIALEGKLMQQQLRAAISRLNEDYQQVIILKFIEGLSNAEVAEILGRSEGAVKSLQHRALTSLRHIMQGGERK